MPDQEFVAGGVAETVVDDLEAIDVEEEHREFEVPAARLRVIRSLDAIHEQQPVRQAGQRIGAARRHLRADPRLRDGEVDRLGDVVVGAGSSASTTSSQLSLAVTMMTGSSETERSRRSCRSVSMPSMPGIITSSSTRSTRCAAAISSAAGPLSAVSTR